jgi:multidrug efflux pump
MRSISTGFVVDDAIVMIENITRYIEDGSRRARPRRRGPQIGFTIISLTVSLVAVLIPPSSWATSSGACSRVWPRTLAVTILCPRRVADADPDDALRLPATPEGKRAGSRRSAAFDCVIARHGTTLGGCCATRRRRRLVATLPQRSCST